VVIRQDIPKWSVTDRPPSRDGILELTIGVDGRIERATLTQGMTPSYDHSLLEATRNWRYDPARVDGRPVRYRKAIRITFQ
jgi:TonB family protein